MPQFLSPGLLMVPPLMLVTVAVGVHTTFMDLVNARRPLEPLLTLPTVMATMVRGTPLRVIVLRVFGAVSTHEQIEKYRK